MTSPELLREIRRSLGQLTWEKDLVWRGGVLLATVGAEEGITHVHVDHLGSTRLLTDRCGQAVATFDLYPFGKTLGDSPQHPQRMRFTGHERDLNARNDDTDDFDYMHARYYKHQWGRFVSVDPIPGDLWVPQSWNAFVYVQDNPLRFLDPGGLTLRAMNSEAQAAICGAVGGDCTKHLAFASDGTVTIEATREELAGNEALAIINDMVSSQKVYGAYVGAALPSESGAVSLGVARVGQKRADNLSTARDERGAKNSPPPGYDGVAGVFAGIETAGNVSTPDGRPVSIALVLLHEMKENYLKTDKLMQYNAAHSGAVASEARLRLQRPELGAYWNGWGGWVVTGLRPR